MEPQQQMPDAPHPGHVSLAVPPESVSEVKARLAEQGIQALTGPRTPDGQAHLEIVPDMDPQDVQQIIAGG